MIGFELIAWYALKGKLDREAEANARERLTPEKFMVWLKHRADERDQDEREATAERRHREIVSAIESAGRRYW